MSIGCDSDDFVYADSSMGAERRYVDSIWIRDTGSFANGPVVASGNGFGSLFNSRVVLANNSANVGAREYDATTSSNATSADSLRSLDTWHHLGGVFRESDPPGGEGAERVIYLDGANVAQVTINRDGGDSFTATRFGGHMDGTGGSSKTARYVAEWSRWDIDGFTEAQTDALLSRLGTKVSGDVTDPRTVNDDPAQAWTGKLVLYRTLADLSEGLLDFIGDGYPDLEISGVPVAYSEHPTVAPYYPWPVIESVTPDPLVDDSAFVIAGGMFKPVGTTAPTVSWGGVSQTVGANSDTEITVTADVGGGLYGPVGASGLLITNEAAAVSFDENVYEMVPASGEAYADITETPATAGLRITSTPDIAIGSQVHYKDFANASAVAQDIDDVTVQADGSITINDNTITRPATLEVRVNLNDGEGWSAFETITLDDPPTPVNPELIGVDEIDAAYFLGESFSITLGEQLAGGTWPWTLEAGGPWPGDFALNAGTGEITGTATPVGAYGPFTIRATGDTTDVDFTVSVSVSYIGGTGTGGNVFNDFSVTFGGLR